MRSKFGQDPGLPYLLDIMQAHSYIFMKANKESVQCPWKGLWLNGSCGLFPNPRCWSEAPATQALVLAKAGPWCCL